MEAHIHTAYKVTKLRLEQYLVGEDKEILHVHRRSMALVPFRNVFKYSQGNLDSCLVFCRSKILFIDFPLGKIGCDSLMTGPMKMAIFFNVISCSLLNVY
jgi:hypothetical protein